MTGPTCQVCLFRSRKVLKDFATKDNFKISAYVVLFIVCLFTDLIDKMYMVRQHDPEFFLSTAHEFVSTLDFIKATGKIPEIHMTKWREFEGTEECIFRFTNCEAETTFFRSVLFVSKEVRGLEHISGLCEFARIAGRQEETTTVSKLDTYDCTQIASNDHFSEYLPFVCVSFVTFMTIVMVMYSGSSNLF